MLALDVERSFNSVEEPRKSELRHQLTTIISTYCAKYQVAYWQGMHDMVAILLLMDPQPPLERIFLLFSMFLQTFLPYVFDDRDCLFLKHLFEMIRLLLQYHDPRWTRRLLSWIELALYLQNHSVIPSIYSPSWLLTLFAHDMSQSLLLSIWDQYIFYKNPATHVFTILAHLISNKARILAYPSSELLELMTHLPFDNDESTYVFHEQTSDILTTSSDDANVDSVCKALNEELRARKCDASIITGIVREGTLLMQKTPSGFIHRLNDILNDRVTVSLESLESYHTSACLMASPLEIYTFLLRGIERNAHCLHYLLLDTRPFPEYRRAHLTQSRNVTKQTLLNLERIDLVVRKARSHDYHIVILDSAGASGKDEVCSELVETLLKRGCRFVSRVVGGFERIAKLIRMEGKEREKELIVGDEESIAATGVWENPREPTSGQESEAKPKEKREMIKTVDGKKCLLYDEWMRNPHVKHYACKKVIKTKKEGKDVYTPTTEKVIVLTKSEWRRGVTCSGFLFVIDILQCIEKGYATIESKFSYDSLESVKDSWIV